MVAIEIIAGTVNKVVDRSSPTRYRSASTIREYAKEAGASGGRIPDHQDKVDYKTVVKKADSLSGDGVKVENEKVQAEPASVNKPSAPREDVREDGERYGPGVPDSGWSKENTDYDYDLSDDRELVVKIVNRKDRSEVIRQYPSKAQLAYKTAFRKFLDMIGL